jgi:DNA replication protein DnaC
MTRMSNAENCILRDVCKIAGTEACRPTCAHFVSMHGASGKGGRVGAMGIPLEYRKFTVAKNPIRASQPIAYKALDAVADSYLRMFDDIDNPKDRIKNVYLYSKSAGTGKTATACALANEWQKLHYIGSLQRGKTPEDDQVYFLDMVEFQTQYNAFNRGNAGGDLAEKAYTKFSMMMQAAKDAALLIMDDIGARGASEGFRTDVHAIINHRYSKKKPTIYTSNVAMDSLPDIFDEKLYDRVRDLTVELPFEGQSKRGKRT